MIGGDDEDEVIFHEALEMEVAALLRAFDEGELDVAAGEGVEHLVGVAAADGDADAGVGVEEGGDEAGQEVLADGLGGADGKLAGLFAIGGGDGGGGLVAEGLEAIGEGKEGGAAGGKGDAAVAAIEEGDSELVFQGLDLLGYGGAG